jgi:hypothetical protein
MLRHAVIRPAAALAAALALSSFAASGARAERKVPQGYIGTVADGVLTDDPQRFFGQIDTMVGAGVESARIVFDWRDAQPYRRRADVPPEQAMFFRSESGVPTDWRSIDAYVEAAARRGMTVLPVMMYAPRWAAKYPGSDPSPPSNFAAYAKFVAAAAKRYGRSGSFWVERPDVPKIPIVRWQLWNEPHFKEFWSDQPWVKAYARLLRLTSKVVKQAVPDAKIVAAGMANKSWTYLSMLYAQKTKGFFDYAAIHPFTNSVDGVVQILEHAREVMARYRDRKRPMIVSELSWTSAKGKAAYTYGNERTEAGQAKALAQGFNRMAKERRRLRIQGVYWYTWMTPDAHELIPFDYAGVVRLEKDGSVTQKPAFGAYRSTALALEGCAQKGSTARTCTQRR